MTDALTRLADAVDDAHEPLGHCEHCSAPIQSGDKATWGGPDALWICEKHSATLVDQIAWYKEMLAEGTVDEWYFDSVDELRAALFILESELAATGNRTMAQVAT